MWQALCQVLLVKQEVGSVDTLKKLVDFPGRKKRYISDIKQYFREELTKYHEVGWYCGEGDSLDKVGSKLRL